MNKSKLDFLQSADTIVFLVFVVVLSRSLKFPRRHIETECALRLMEQKKFRHLPRKNQTAEIKNPSPLHLIPDINNNKSNKDYGTNFKFSTS